MFGDGTHSRASTHVSEAAPIIAAAVDCPAAYSEVVNVGADSACSVRDLATLVQQVMKADTGITFLPPREEVAHAWSDHSKARRILGYEPKVTLEAGIARMAAWALAVGPRQYNPSENIEVNNHLLDSLPGYTQRK